MLLSPCRMAGMAGAGDLHCSFRGGNRVKQRCFELYYIKHVTIPEPGRFECWTWGLKKWSSGDLWILDRTTIWWPKCKVELSVMGWGSLQLQRDFVESSVPDTKRIPLSQWKVLFSKTAMNLRKSTGTTGARSQGCTHDCIEKLSPAPQKCIHTHVGLCEKMVPWEWF